MASIITPDFPEEVWINIFSYLRPVEICRARLVCKHWAFLSTATRIKKKFCLRLHDLYTTQEIKAFLTQNSTNYLPTYSLDIMDQDDSVDLEYILKSFGQNFHQLKIQDSIVFNTLESANLMNIEELHFEFKSTEPELLSGLNTQFIRSYKKLTSLNVLLQNNNGFLGNKILQEISDMHTILSMQHLQFNYNNTMSDTCIKIMSRYASTLKELEIVFDVSNDHLIPANFPEVFSKLKNLELLGISCKSGFELVSLMLENLPKSAPLRSIEMFPFPGLTDELLLLIVNKWTNTIKKLTIYFNNKVTEKSAAEIWKLNKNLETLVLGLCCKININDLLSAVARDINYTHRRLSLFSINCDSEEGLCRLVKNLPNLEILEFFQGGAYFTNKVLTYIFRYQTRLRKVVLNGCHSFNDNGIAGLGVPEWQTSYPITRLCNLEELCLEGCSKLKEDFIDYLLLPNLRQLRLHNLEHISADGYCKIVNNCPNLESLDIFNCNGLNDEVVYYICDNLKLLFELNIQVCPGITDGVVEDAIYYKNVRIPKNEVMLCIQIMKQQN